MVALPDDEKTLTISITV